MYTRDVRVETGRGHALAARLDLPDGPAPRAFALLAHCFTCNKDLRGLVALSRTLVDAGWGVLRLDFTGLGDSEGEFSDSTFSHDVDEVVQAAARLAEIAAPPTLLVGHSLGGAAVLRAAPRIDSVTAVATIGAPASPRHVERLLRSSREEIEREGSAWVELAGRRFRITAEFLHDLAEHPMRETIGQLRRALLVMHAPQDDTVGIDQATEIFTAAKHPKSFVSLAGADHLLSQLADARFAGSVIAAWADRYLPAALRQPPPAHHEDPVVVYGPRRRFTTTAMAGVHRVVIDEPAESGGADEGPTPYGLLLSALGACTAMTLRMYADRKGWGLSHADVRLSHDRLHAEDAAGERVRLERIEREVELVGDLDAAQRARLAEIADRCPVHRTLTGTLEIVTRLSESESESAPEPGSTPD